NPNEQLKTLPKPSAKFVPNQFLHTPDTRITSSFATSSSTRVSQPPTASLSSTTRIPQSPSVSSLSSARFPFVPTNLSLSGTSILSPSSFNESSFLINPVSMKTSPSASNFSYNPVLTKPSPLTYIFIYRFGKIANGCLVKRGPKYSIARPATIEGLIEKGRKAYKDDTIMHVYIESGARLCDTDFEDRNVFLLTETEANVVDREDF
ncbi:hypothetical protein HK098_002486, partial [Nowakowskiella sp. JEL0407]